MKKELEKYSDELIQDRLGGVFGVRKGPENAPKIMVAGHMDEVGFMVSSITKNGMIRFQTLGGWWSQVMLAQRVDVHTDHGPIPGVVSSTPPHLLTPEQKSKPVKPSDMLIDIGADSEEEAKELGVRPGQQIVPATVFTPMANPKRF